MGKVNRKLPPTPAHDRIRDWHFDAIDTLTRQHIERIANSGMCPKESLRHLMRGLKAHRTELSRRMWQERIMLGRESEAMKLDRSRAASSGVQYDFVDRAAEPDDTDEYYNGIEDDKGDIFHGGKL